MPSDPARAEALFREALQHRRPGECEAFLAKACAQEPELAEEVRRLLRAFNTDIAKRDRLRVAIVSQ